MLSTESLQCYICQSLHSGESCNQTQSCYHSHTFCTTLVSHGNTGEHLERHTWGGVREEAHPDTHALPLPPTLYTP